MAKRAKRTVLCDTGIFIRAIRRNIFMRNELDDLGFDRIALSAISKAELYYGMKKQKVQKTKTLLNQFHYFPIDIAISAKFVSLMYEYRHYHPKIGRTTVNCAILLFSALCCCY